MHVPHRLSGALLGLAVTAGTLTAATAPVHALVPEAPAQAAPAQPARVSPARAADRPSVYAEAAHLIDTATGQVHYSKEADVRRPVASLTKMMTAYVVLQQAKPSDKVKVSAEDVRYAARGGAAVAYLRAGDTLTVEDMLHALLLPSGADAAHALARTYGPGVEKFVDRMNATARQLGMNDTLYVNADGMPYGGGGHSTARDQVRLAQAVLDDPTLAKVTATRHHTVPATSEHRSYSWKNTNRLLGVPGALGVKTGFTRAAGYTLAFGAERGGSRLIGVLLGETSSARRFQTAEALIDWAAGAAAQR